MEIRTNKSWDSKQPRITVITPVFNRFKELERTIESVEKQTYRDFEYIIVDDGSTIDLDSIIKPFMERASFPVCFIKKENGGVHTARNAAIKYARGEMIADIDSDDELIENALEVLINAWDSIPKDKQSEYREVCARCVDENGNEIGPRFPDNFNSFSDKQIRRFFSKHSMDRYGFWRADTLKANPWPEVDGVTFAAEGIVWQVLGNQYKSFYINDFAIVYHHENPDSYTRSNKITIQTIINRAWNATFILNHWRKNSYHGFKKYFKTILTFSVYKHLLRKVKNPRIKLESFRDKLLYILLWIPAFIVSFKFKKRITDK